MKFTVHLVMNLLSQTISYVQTVRKHSNKPVMNAKKKSERVGLYVPIAKVNKRKTKNIKKTKKRLINSVSFLISISLQYSQFFPEHRFLSRFLFPQATLRQFPEILLLRELSLCLHLLKFEFLRVVFQELVLK